MVYTDSYFLMADTTEYLHQMARKLGIPEEQYAEYPVPHYLLDSESYHNTIRQGITQMPTAQLLHRYSQRKRRK